MYRRSFVSWEWEGEERSTGEETGNKSSYSIELDEKREAVPREVAQIPGLFSFGSVHVSQLTGKKSSNLISLNARRWGY